ncbi:gamma-glutamyltransferase [Corynebacterium sp. zg-331]|uniref:gamma-glutamyltransferase n=1 Tax=unclassified Corynebacterium TaxID=2624378 RepID=UPI001642C538|nr:MULTISPECIES: gamma-glutamyltransferase [unclassified Corynebacterium]MBC3185335.1 gamma-glutamyltransferase [Corynebacterium sp. zg-331]
MLITALVGAGVSGCSTRDEPAAIANQPQCEVTGENVEAYSVEYLAATTHPEATRAACDVLAEGGSAADALIAAQAVLGLVEPQSSGPGGGAIAVYYDAATGDTRAYDATVHSLANDDAASAGADEKVRSIGVPQTLRLLRQLHEDHATLPLESLVDPAYRLGTSGFRTSARLAAAMEDNQRPFRLSEPGAVLRNASGDRPAEGDELTNKPYADFLRQWAHRGTLSEDTVAAMRSELLDQAAGEEYVDGLLAQWRRDLETPVESREALCTDFSGTSVCGNPSTATGMMVVAQALGIMRHLDLARLEPYSEDGAPVARATAAHLMTEAERLAFTDANTWMDDPLFYPERARAYLDRVVTNEDYLAAKAAEIGQKRSVDDPQPAALEGFDQHGYEDSQEEGTAQMTVVDSQGNVASMTTTLQRNFGSGLMTQGFFLNNSLDNFASSASPEAPNGRRNASAPRTMMAPLIAREGEDVVGLGSPGGRKIPSYNLKNLVAMTQWGLSPAEAIAMPNFGADNRNGVYAETMYGEETLSRQGALQRLLREWGQPVSVGEADSGAGIVRRTPDGVEGGADPRRGGAVAGG